jgi:competence protein ComEA
MMNQWFEERKTLVLAIIGFLIVAGVAAFSIRWRPAESIVIEPPAPTATPGPIQVYVSGAVAQAGVYVLPPDAIVLDAIEAAGGANSDADLSHLNLAQHLSDGEQVHVPQIGESSVLPSQSEDGESEVTVTWPLNINTAAQAELETLPGIGPVLAQRIIEYREAHGPFATIEDIQNVPGIGPEKFDDIKDLITVE